MSRLLQKPGFLDFGAWGSETGFLPKSRWGFQDDRRNPVSWILGRGAQKPGFFLNLGEDSKIIAETRFLGFGEKPKQKAPLFLGALFVNQKLKLSR